MKQLRVGDLYLFKKSGNIVKIVELGRSDKRILVERIDTKKRMIVTPDGLIDIPIEKKYMKQRADNVKRDEHKIKVRVVRDDKVGKAFAAYLTPSLTETGRAEVLLNIEAIFHASAENRIDPREFLIECIMHEVGHALQEYFQLKFSEKAVNKIVAAYIDKYNTPKVAKYKKSRI